MRRSIATNYGPKVTWDQLQVGVRIYYTGDMANASANGTVVARTDGKWGRQVDIQLDDGYLTRGIHDSLFQPGPGRRFWLSDDWKADQEAKQALFFQDRG